MPTGGGKSVCYQLPAAISSGKTVIVISPLIALMQDQVAQLDQMGIPAALLNSSLAQGEQSKIMREATEGRYRLLYLSPERIARADSLGWLQRVPVSFFAIDEAHCISEWGHEFRPEYRQLSRLRAEFPHQPSAAFTASATQQVRHDIIEQLRLRDPDKYIASFHRPNLRYVVNQCDARTQPGLLVKALKSYAGSNVIVYSPTIKRVEETVSFLSEQGIPALPYHAKMGNAARQKNQERWMSDEVRVLVGTIAFGLGINKAAVRAVIHLSLPKSIEQYYQEAGRAGRDGEPADCVLLWQKRDAGLLGHFIGEITDPQEKERAWQRYNQIRRFVESNDCRHRQICSHFGENTKWKSCDACDVCGYQPVWLSTAVEAEQAKRGKAAIVTAPTAAATGTPARRTQRPEQPDKSTAKLPDPELREYMREWRRTTAKEKGVPAYVVLHDTSLDELCRIQPRTLTELRHVHGFGERKTELFGPAILDALGRFRGGARATQAPIAKSARA
jgi:ATP-dependent DNA helicase RecQ